MEALDRCITGRRTMEEWAVMQRAKWYYQFVVADADEQAYILRYEAACDKASGGTGKRPTNLSYRGDLLDKVKAHPLVHLRCFGEEVGGVKTFGQWAAALGYASAETYTHNGPMPIPNLEALNKCLEDQAVYEAAKAEVEAGNTENPVINFLYEFCFGAQIGLAEVWESL